MSLARETDIRALLLDYGGVLAEEGFREGLKAIGRSTEMGPDEFFAIASEAVYESGYLTGRAKEHEYWDAVREQTSVEASDEAMRDAILTRFVLRAWMLDLVRIVRSAGYMVCVLSDQTDWLDQLDRRDHFFKEFDEVFNSYYLGKGKRDDTIFLDVAAAMKVAPEHILFVDDNEGHIARAQSKGFHTILYRDKESLLKEMHAYNLV